MRCNARPYGDVAVVEMLDLEQAVFAVQRNIHPD